MSLAVSKTISLFLLMAIGFFLQKKIPTKSEQSGLKVIILSVALPAMIFVAIQKIEFSWSMLIFPVMVFAFNLAFFYLTPLIVRMLGIAHNEIELRTIRMLVPSLAPGLSCFPFVLEFLGEESLAQAAIADIGNKVFVLIVLYVIALNWYNQLQRKSNKSSKNVKSLLKALVNEPVNLVIILGLLMLAFGINYETLPFFLKSTIDRISTIMTPLILIFTGISITFKWDQIKRIISILLARSGLGFFMGGVILLAFQISDPTLATLVILLTQCSCSFWPYAHICMVAKMEAQSGNENKTFDQDLALNILALSLPFSTLTIIGLCTYGEGTGNSVFPFIISAILFIGAFLPFAIKSIKKKLRPSMA